MAGTVVMKGSRCFLSMGATGWILNLINPFSESCFLEHVLIKGEAVWKHHYKATCPLCSCSTEDPFFLYLKTSVGHLRALS